MGLFSAIGGFAKKALPIAASFIPGGSGIMDTLGGFLKDHGKDLAVGAIGAKGLLDARNDRKKRDAALQERLDFAHQLVEETEGVRGASTSAIEARVKRGVLPPPDLGGIADTANPFRSRFSFERNDPAPEPEGIPTRTAVPRAPQSSGGIASKLKKGRGTRPPSDRGREGSAIRNFRENR